MVSISNKNAKREYEIEKTWQAGIVLTGPEAKSIRLGQASLKGSHVKLIQNEAYLLNAQITPYKYSDQREVDPKRSRKLLLRKSELEQMQGLSEQKNRTLVPLSLESGKHTIKLIVGLGRGLKQYERRELVKKRDLKREVETQVKGKLKGF